jgi:glycosyltransferase involved in cell wall biosynthesis
MTSIPLVSIITPSYNQASFLEATIRSVLEQDYPHIEYIICDGGSTDGSVDVIRKYEKHLAWWCSEKDSGQSEAINKGLARANGDIVAWLNSDDLYLKHGVTAIVNAFQAHSEAGLIYGNLELIDEQSQIIGQHPARPFTFADQLTHRLIIPQPAAFWKRDLHSKIGLLRQDLHYAMDFELWIRIGLHFPIVYIPEPVAQFRISSVNKSSAQSSKWGAEFLKILDDLYATPNLPVEVSQLKMAAYAGAYWMGAQTYFTALDMSKARQWLWKAARYDVSYFIRPAWWTVFLKTFLGQNLNQWGRRNKSNLGDRFKIISY